MRGKGREREKQIQKRGSARVLNELKEVYMDRASMPYDQEARNFSFSQTSLELSRTIYVAINLGNSDDEKKGIEVFQGQKRRIESNCTDK